MTGTSRHAPGFHDVVEGVAAAAPHCEARVGSTALPPLALLPASLGLPRRARELTRSALQHLLLPRSVLALAGCDLIVLRDFLTLPFLLAAARLVPLRRRLLLTLTHNLQQARERPLHRGVLRALRRVGFGFCCLESDAGYAEVLSARPGQEPLVLPHLIREAEARPPAPRSDAQPRIGVVGVARPEKNAESLLERLAQLRDQGALRAELLLGCPEPDRARRWAGRVDRVVDTRARAAYEAALRSCDALVLDYSARRYWLRSSAVITDAVAQGCAVVGPDYPVLRAQVTQPRPVGALFTTPEDLVPAIGRALARRRGDPEAFLAYRLARGPRAIAERIDRYVRARRDALAADAPGAGD